MKKKIIFLIIDGMADDPSGDFLRKADIPNLDYLANIGIVKGVRIIKDQEPESDVAIVRLFGYDTSEEGYPGRGPLEAYGEGLISPEEENYLAWRANFATFTRRKNSVFEAEVEDSRVGRTLTNEHAAILANILNEKAREVFSKEGVEILIKPTVEHRAVVIFKGKKFNPHISNLDPFYIRMKDGTTRAIKPTSKKIERCVAFEGDSYTADLANRYLDFCYKVLDNFSIEEREKNGLQVANGIMMRNAGDRIIPLYKNLPIKWAAKVGMPMEKGIALAGKMNLESFEYPPISLDIALKTKEKGKEALYEHFFKNLKTEIEEYTSYLDRLDSLDEEAFWIHCKPLDIAGHDGFLDKKREMLERIDSTIVKKIRELVESSRYIAVITSDHATVCSLRKHTSDKVPAIIAGLGRDSNEKFDEKSYKDSQEIESLDLLKQVYEKL